MDGLFGDGLVDDVLFCGGDSLEEDLPLSISIETIWEWPHPMLVVYC